MKLVRYGPKGSEEPGVIDPDGCVRSLKGQYGDLAGDRLLPSSLIRLADIDISSLPLVSKAERIGPCVAEIGKIVCIGLNYSDHAAETGMDLPAEPVLFMKATTAVSGPNDPVTIPRGSRKTDWECELGVVIGKRAKYVLEEESLEHVAGYCIVNDISERAFQLEGTGQWVKGKSCDTFAPIGPWLVTKDEIPDPQNLKMWLDVNGHRYQNGSSQTMVFGVAHLVSYLSHFMTLEPGDIIATGTPAGVGLGQKPPVFLKAGDRMRLGIEGLGVQCQDVIAEDGASEILKRRSERPVV